MRGRDMSSLFGLSARGVDLDVPVPSPKLPQKVRGILQRLAYVCAFASDQGGHTAKKCPHTSCRLWRFRLGQWPELETGRAEPGEAENLLSGLLNGLPPNSRLDCHACDPKRVCKLFGFGWLRRAKVADLGGCASVVNNPETLELSVTKCVCCGRGFRATRTDAKYCGPRCRQRANRRRLETTNAL